MADSSLPALFKDGSANLTWIASLTSDPLVDPLTVHKGYFFKLWPPSLQLKKPSGGKRKTSLRKTLASPVIHSDITLDNCDLDE